jgi:hypothetical protein
MTADNGQGEHSEVELLHPFYLDTDMSMAFAAALAGGVALEREDVEHEAQESEAVRNLRGNLRLFGALGLGGGTAGVQGDRTAKASELATTESRLVRHHTEASIFIALHDELRRTNRIADAEDLSTLQPGEIISLSIGPAVAPLRRLVDQLIRLLDVAAPLIGIGGEAQSGAESRQVRRQQAREAAKHADGSDESSDAANLTALRGLLLALKDDLDQSGMIDVVVDREDEPSVVLTLDKRFLSDQSLELLHTSHFRVIGKVTQVWPADEDFVNLYRRSVISLLPALGQTVTWGMFTLLASMAGGLDPDAAEEAARVAGRVPASTEDEDDATSGSEADTEGEEPDEDELDAAPREDGAEQPEVLIGDEAIKALNPAVSGPAIQVLPLAIST